MAISFYDVASTSQAHTDLKGGASAFDLPVGPVGTVSAGQYLLSSIHWNGIQDVTTWPNYCTINGAGVGGGVEITRHNLPGYLGSIQQFAGFVSAGSTSSTVNGSVQPASNYYGTMAVGLILDVDSSLVSLTHHTANGTGAVPTSYTHTGVHLRPGDFVRVVMVNYDTSGSGSGGITSSASLSMPGITFGAVTQRWCFSGSIGGTVPPGSGQQSGEPGAQWSQFTTTVTAGEATDTLTITPGSFTLGGTETHWYAFIQIVHEATQHDASASLSAQSSLTADASALTPLGYANVLGGPAANLSSPNRLGVSKASTEGYATAGNFDVVLAMDNGTWTWSPGDTGKMRVWDAQGSWYGKVEDIHADADNGNIAILSGIMPATPSGTNNNNIEIDIDDGVLGCIRWGVSWATGGSDAHVVRTYDTGGIASYTTTSQLFDLGTDWDIQTGDQFMFLCWAIEQRPTASVSTPTASAVSLFASGATAVTTQRYTKMTPLAQNNYFWGGNANEIGVRLSGYTASITAGSATSPDIIASFNNTNADVVRWTVVQVRQGTGPGGGGPTTHNGASALSVQSEGSASATLTAFVGAALAAATVFTSVGTAVVPGASTLTGQSGLTASGSVLVDGSAALTAESDLTADALSGQSSAATLSAESGLTAAGEYVAVASSGLTVESVVTATGLQGWAASAALTAQSDVTATAESSATHDGDAALTAESSLAATGAVTAVAGATLSAQSAMTVIAGELQTASADLSAQSELTAVNSPDLEWFQNRGGGAGGDDITDPYSNEFIWTTNSDTSINRMAAGDLIYAFYGSEEDDPYGDYEGMLRPYGQTSWLGSRFARTPAASGYSPSVLLLATANAANSGANYESEIRGIYGYNRHGYGGHFRSLNGYYDIDTAVYQGTSQTTGSKALGDIDLAPGDIIVLHFAAHSASVSTGATLSASGYTFSSETNVNVRGIGQTSVTLFGDFKSDRRVYAKQFEVLAGPSGSTSLSANITLGGTANLLDIITLRVRKSAVPLPVLDAAGLSFESDLAATAESFKVGSSALSAESVLTSAGVGIILTPTSALTAESDLASDSTRIAVAASALSAESTLTGVGSYVAMGSASLVGASSATLTAVAVRPGDVALVASSSLTADGFVTLGSTADLTGESDLSVSGVMLSATAAMAADSSVSASAIRIQPGSSDLSSTSTLAVSGVTLLGSASLTGETVLTSDGTPVRPAASTVTAETDLTADGWVIFGSTVGISAQSNMEGAAVRVSLGASGLTVQSSLTAVATKVTRATTTLTGQGTLTAQAGTWASAQSTLSATLTVTASGGFVIDATVTMSGQSNIAPVDYEYFVGVPNSSVALSGQTVLTAVTSPIYRLNLPGLERTYTQDRLWKRYPISTQACLIIKDGVATVKDWPNDLELKQADYYWMGGYNNPLNAETRQVIIDAGYGDLIEEA